MKLKRIGLLLLLPVVVLTLPGSAAASKSNFGHVSFVEEHAFILRSDGAEQKAVVNLPLVPGDTVVTGDSGRCELQFDNGTVIRLDKNTRLQLTTVQAPSLSSRWSVTTLNLPQGQVYTLPQTYNREMFQIITPNAAVKLENRTAATIRFDADLGTTLFSDAGTFEVLYGRSGKAPEKIKVKSGQAFVIDPAHVLAGWGEKRNLEFVAWNEYVDRHFKELHYGISKVPPKLKFGNSALQHWAEKWSSRFGEWTYDELFGYVWKPAADHFANSARPFFHAAHVQINGRLFLVPQESWGWVPAHMGTWVWLNRGWTWIPGDWFHSGIVDFLGISTYPTMDYYFLMGYGYRLYRRYGISSWRLDYLRQYYQEVWEQIKESWVNKAELEPDLDVFPDKLEKIFRRVTRGPATNVSMRLGLGPLSSLINGDKLPLDSQAKPRRSIPDATGKARPGADLRARNESKHRSGNHPVRDWNPDNFWAAQRGYSILYSSSRNAVVCPELNIYSDLHSVLRQGGRDRAGVPVRANLPENVSQPPPSSPSGVDSAVPPAPMDDRSKQKEDPEK